MFNNDLHVNKISSLKKIIGENKSLSDKEKFSQCKELFLKNLNDDSTREGLKGYLKLSLAQIEKFDNKSNAVFSEYIHDKSIENLPEKYIAEPSVLSLLCDLISHFPLQELHLTADLFLENVEKNLLCLPRNVLYEKHHQAFSVLQNKDKRKALCDLEEAINTAVIEEKFPRKGIPSFCEEPLAAFFLHLNSNLMLTQDEFDLKLISKTSLKSCRKIGICFIANMRNILNGVSDPRPRENFYTNFGLLLQDESVFQKLIELERSINREIIINHKQFLALKDPYQEICLHALLTANSQFMLVKQDRSKITNNRIKTFGFREFYLLKKYFLSECASLSPPSKMGFIPIFQWINGKQVVTQDGKNFPCDLRESVKKEYQLKKYHFIQQRFKKDDSLELLRLALENSKAEREKLTQNKKQKKDVSNILKDGWDDLTNKLNLSEPNKNTNAEKIFSFFEEKTHQPLLMDESSNQKLQQDERKENSAIKSL